MEEAEYCDHVVILDHGRVLAHGSSAEIRGQVCVNAGREPTMEDAFIAIVEESSRNQTETAVGMRAMA
jgi:ABC-2 type transport system ATP-binding protein